jgi:hypothetical protein
MTESLGVLMGSNQSLSIKEQTLQATTGIAFSPLNETGAMVSLP